MGGEEIVHGVTEGSRLFERAAQEVGATDGGQTVNPGGEIVLLASQVFIVVVRVDLCGQPELPEMVDTLNRLGLALGAREGGQEESREDGDDGDDHEQFDQCEGLLGRSFQSFCSRFRWAAEPENGSAARCGLNV